MAAYILVDVTIHDEEKYAEYRSQTAATLEPYGGRFIVRGGNVLVLEGDWKPQRLVVLEFDTVEQAKAWWSSDAYRAPKKLRQSASTANMIVVEGA